jgi:putative addiction module CopG family antidote
MNVSITDELASYVRKKVKSGRYNSASEVVRDALRRMEEEDSRAIRLAQPTAEALLADMSEQQMEAVRRRVLGGIQEIDAGNFNSYDGSTGLRDLAGKVKARGRNRLTRRTSRPSLQDR